MLVCVRVWYPSVMSDALEISLIAAPGGANKVEFSYLSRLGNPPPPSNCGGPLTRLTGGLAMNVAHSPDLVQLPNIHLYSAKEKYLTLFSKKLNNFTARFKLSE